MFYRVRRLYQPEFYQGTDRLTRYFEGWYYKSVFPDRAFALIPGVSRSPDDPHAFVQYVDGDLGTSSYHRFPLDSFRYRKDRFEVSIGPHRFGGDGFTVDLPEISCDLSVASATGWPSSLFSPGTMGWYSFVPLMECKHSVVVMDGDVSGTLDGHSVAGGRFYLEKDYGRSFPNSWVWLQTNCFGDETGRGTVAWPSGTSITCSVANVPFVGGAFTGFLAAFLHDGVLHRFTTYTGARLTALSASDAEVSLTLADPKKTLEITASREPGVTLAAPADGAMTGRIVETLRSSVRVRLVIDGDLRFEGLGRRAGLEVVAPERLELAK